MDTKRNGEALVAVDCRARSILAPLRRAPAPRLNPDGRGALLRNKPALIAFICPARLAPAQPGRAAFAPLRSRPPRTHARGFFVGRMLRLLQSC